MIVTNVGAGCDGRGWCRTTNDTNADGKAVWSWRPDAGVKFCGVTRKRRWQTSPVTGESTE